MKDLAFALCLGVALLSLVCLLRDGSLWQPALARIAAHERRLDSSLRFLRRRTKARRLLVLEGALLCVGIAALLFLPAEPVWGAFAIVLAFGPSLLLARARAARVALINAQVEPMLGAIARALVAAPSLGEALSSSRSVVQAPLGDEIGETLEEFHLGTNLDLALSHLTERVPSENLRVAVLTLKLGQKSGGRLGGILETTAQTMREMERLEGVLRTKTAEGKAQTFVIALVPGGLVGAMHAMNPGYFAPLEATFTGNVIVLVSVGLWIGAIFLARQILAVDL